MLYGGEIRAGENECMLSVFLHAQSEKVAQVKSCA